MEPTVRPAASEVLREISKLSSVMDHLWDLRPSPIDYLLCLRLITGSLGGISL